MSLAFPVFRTDLQVARRADGNFLVTDPVTGQHFLFSEVELSLAKWLCQAETLEQWCDGWNLENRTQQLTPCLLYTSPSPRDATLSRMPSSA